MNTDTYIRHVDGRGAVPHKVEEPDPAHLVPFGPYGAGQMTAHPIGLVIVIGILLMGLFSRTPAAFLLFTSFVPGCIWGFVLWSRHREQKQDTEQGLTFLRL
jgi:hypothetical protein